MEVGWNGANADIDIIVRLDLECKSSWGRLDPHPLVVVRVVEDL